MSENFTYLHTMLRVKNLDASVDFYTMLLGMRELRRTEVPDGKYTLAFIGYGDEKSNTVLELTYNWGKDDGYELGTAGGQLALGVPDIYATCEQLRNSGAKIA